jgi:hypothetical protein
MPMVSVMKEQQASRRRRLCRQRVRWKLRRRPREMDICSALLPGTGRTVVLVGKQTGPDEERECT